MQKRSKRCKKRSETRVTSLRSKICNKIKKTILFFVTHDIYLLLLYNVMQICGVIVHESALNRAAANCENAFSRGALVKFQDVSNFRKAPTDYAGFESPCLWREFRRNGAFNRNFACRFYRRHH